MATLHVRNVPDDLYELLRERAAENDRSIGAETVQLLQEHLMATRTAQTLGRLRRRRRRGLRSGSRRDEKPNGDEIESEHARYECHWRSGVHRCD